MSSSSLEIRDRRGKKTRLGNMFKKGKSREPTADVTSTVGGGSLLSGGGSSVHNAAGPGGKRGGGASGPGQGGQGSAGSTSLVSATGGTFSGANVVTQPQQPVLQSGTLSGPQMAITVPNVPPPPPHGTEDVEVLVVSYINHTC